ncbi:MAG: ABC transporter ATP-binding protein [Bradyrhizobiaceae bacterium]|nr:MAG: ABC transporter ATP-binding protein [Bradyrhizobiaceae bacterium]
MSVGLSIRDGNKIYRSKRGSVVALSGVDLDVGQNEFCAIVGPSGCGKTTLLNAIAGFESLSSGTISLDGKVIGGADWSARADASRIVVFQNGALFPWRTVLWNVTCGPVQQGKLSVKEASSQAIDLLNRVGLRGIENKYPDELSGGQQRRVEIVRALLNDPKILLLDEPFRAMDALTKSVMQEYLSDLLFKLPKTVFFITHDLDEAIFLADRVCVFSSRPGRIKQSVKVDIPKPRTHEVLTSPEFLRIKAALNDALHEEAVQAFKLGELELAR